MPDYTLLDERDVRRFWSHVRITHNDKECWDWKLSTRAGYGAFRAKRQLFEAHRLAWELTSGDIPEGLLVCHVCDRRICANPHCLFLGTYQDNVDDMIRKGRNAVGLKNGAHTKPESILRGIAHKDARFTEEQVRLIRKLDAEGVSRYELAKEFSVSYNAIKRIAIRQTWTHLDDEQDAA